MNLQFDDLMFNTIRALEDRAIQADTEIEAECLIEIANAIERTYGIITQLHA